MNDVSIADATLASPQRRSDDCLQPPASVSIADATLASPQHHQIRVGKWFVDGFNRRRDACFPATCGSCRTEIPLPRFQSQTRRLLPRN